MNKQWMKDPLRYAMEARLSGKKQFALGAVLLFLYDELLRRFARLYRRRKRG